MSAADRSSAKQDHCSQNSKERNEKAEEKTGLFLTEEPPSRLKQPVNLSPATSEEEFTIAEFFVHITLSYLGSGDRSVSMLYASHHDTFYCPGLV